MKEIPYFLSLTEAIELSLRHKISRTIEQVPLNKSHLRILAEDLTSKVKLVMDGLGLSNLTLLKEVLTPRLEMLLLKMPLFQKVLKELVNFLLVT